MTEWEDGRRDVLGAEEDGKRRSRRTTIWVVVIGG
jgi:hypothetical protein